MNVKHLLKEFYRIEQRPELIWGVGAGYLEGGVAAQQIARALNLPWLFELHDPPRRAGLGPDNRIVKTRFSELLHDAVRVIVTADSYKSSIVRQYQLKHEKVCTIHLSYDGKSITANEKMKEHCFTLAYAGSLSGGRTMKPLLLAITAAFEKQPKMRQMFKLELAGAGAGFDEINQLSPALGLTKNIEYHGLIPGNMVAALLERAVAVIVIENSSKLQVPGKIFEILKVGKAILGLMPQDCEAAKILIQAGLGFIHKANDIKDITETLIRMWQAWREDKVITKPNESFIQGFSAEQLPIKLADALRDYVHIQNFESEIN